MTHRSSYLLLAVLLATSASGVAVAAAPAAGKAPAAPRHLDTNGDGQIDRAEARASTRLSARFDTFDKNSDGQLSFDELSRTLVLSGKRDGERGGPRAWAHFGGGPVGMGMYGAMDADGDGRISAAEAKAHFDKLDANKDGYIDAADQQARAEQRRAQWFADADTDKDGKLSPAELAAAREEAGPHIRIMRAPKPAKAPAGK